MGKDEGIQMETTSSFLAHMLKEGEEGQTFVEAYLKSSFLSSAVDALFYARRQAGLTQAQVAEQLKTKQAAIARLEADTTGSMSLRRFVEVAMACGMAPFDIQLVPISSLREYIIANPDAPKTPDAYNTWTTRSIQAGPTSTYTAQDTTSVNVTATITYQDTQLALDHVDEYLKRPSQEWPFKGVTSTASSAQTRSITSPHFHGKVAA
ncbi:MAG TPA: helix-turn-helix transcriptional regulator [Ktedonosporobacter sp.]|jgi:transcriptional regulator with XRE-family HTH domain|nr:helix-turn-helix transcriptional regulator [Ktedonosporobacter sp.]